MTFIRWLRSVIDRVKLALMVFRKGLPKEETETDKAVADVISGMRKPGFPCPRCNAPIIVSIPDLLARSSVCCPQCELELKMDWQADARARRALENIQGAVVEVERAKKFRG